MNNTSNSFFTYKRDGRTESLLAGTLKELADRIGGNPKLAGVRAVVLGGGYGRGEGGSTPEGALYNDLDFFVFPGKGQDNRQLALEFGKLSEHFGRQLGIEVDFFIVPAAGWLNENRETLMVQELLAGHRFLTGDSGVFGKSALLPWDKLPWQEGARLLINRGTGLLLSRMKLEAGTADYDFINRNIHKAYLGCGDALLIAAKAYCRTGMERLEALKQIGAAELLVAGYAEALKFKYTPSPAPEGSYWARLGEAEKIWRATLAEFAGKITGYYGTAAEACDGLLNFRSAKAHGGVLKNILRSMFYAFRLGRLRPLSEHPRLKLLPLLKAAINDKNLRQKYLTLWRKLN